MLSVAALVVASSMMVGQAEVKVPEKILAQMEFLVGEWEVEGDHGGKAFKGTYSAKWSPNKHCLILTIHDHRGISSGIGGWDPSDNTYLEMWYVPDGTQIELRSNGMKATGWDGTALLTDASGKKLKGTIRTSKNGNDEFTFTGDTEDGVTYATRNKRVKK